MSKLMRLLCLVLSSGVASLWAPATAHGFAFFGGPWHCGSPAFVDSDRNVITRCADAATGTVSLLTGTQAAIAASAFWSWQELNFSTPWIFLDTSTPCTNASVPATDNRSIAWLSSNAAPGLAGRMTPQFECFFSPPNMAFIDIEVNTSSPNQHTNCRTPRLTEDGVWSHEIGHGYGYAHFDDWLSTMNTFSPDVTSCRPNFSVRPSSDAQQGHDNHPRYGLPAAVDVGGTPLIAAGCNIASSPSCVTAPVVITTVPASATTVSGNVPFTSMNMRDAWPSGSITVNLWLSKNHVLDSGDVFLSQWFLSPTFAGAIYEYTLPITFNPQVIPLGDLWTVLVQFDPNNDFAEFDETDNVTDTNIQFRRMSM